MSAGMNVAQADFDRLVDLITQEVMAHLARSGVSTLSECSTCNGQCLSTCPDRVSAAFAAGASRISATLGARRPAAEIAAMIDHTLLKPDATKDQIRQLCQEAKEYGFASVCINPAWVELAADLLRGTPVAVCTVIGFPLGATLTEVKAYESERAIAFGARELDMVINIGALKSREYAWVEEDIRSVVNVAHPRGAIVKVIIEAALLTDDEKVKACTLAKAARADYVKTSTGFGPGGATVEDVALMRRVVGPEVGVKAAGGIRTYEDAKAMVQAGATRIGASAGVKIVQGAAGSGG